ncbi:unnamed protein product [Durusdinium trenchii]|uniref:Carboxylic ester hydrolase n=2 Tax=Durusdinium trenchii TaxID=1381693 RepID=A0ABP0JDY9_9DINO
MTISIWSLLLLQPAFGIELRRKHLEGHTITLPSGAQVLGQVLSSPDGDVVAYGDLRYATAERFEAPSLYTAPAGEVIDGTKINERCVQKGHGDSVEGVEDCLTLAVFVPTSTSSEGKRPVLVFIHGGFLISGSVADYYGKLNYMANQANAVVVAIQYRLNLFGFLQPPADIESIPANRGLRDQIESLKWVQKNIASFGGDAESVTLWGQSAGARSVVALYNSPMSTGLFHQAIAMSPGYIPAMFQADISLVQETFGHRCMEATKCSSLKCLKEMKVETLAKSCIFYLQAEDFVTVPGVYFSGFDGEVLEKPVRAPLCSDWSPPNSHVPIILGSMAHEWRSFQMGLPGSSFVERFLQDALPNWNAAQVSCLRSYTMDLFQGAPCPPNVSICKLIPETDSVQAATQVYSMGTEFAGQGTGARYRYLMDTDAAGGWCGACHGADLDCVLHAYGHPPFPAEKWMKFRELFVGYLASFVQYGTPKGTAAYAASWSPSKENGQSGVPVMQFNLSKAENEMSGSVYFSDEAMEDISNTLCGNPLSRCATV